jgi:putative transcriptional regulator
MATIARMHQKDFAALLLGAVLLWISQAASAEHGERITVLVAHPGLADAAYAHSVVVLQRSENEEVGVIINRPSDYAVADVLDAPAAEKQADPLYSGGPFLPQQLIALIRDEKSPGKGSMQLARGLHLSIGTATLERSLERSPGTARFYAGLVLWQPGELAEEVKRGLWLKLEVPLETVFRRDAEGLWDELLAAAQAVRT